MLASGLLVMGCVTHPFLRHVRGPKILHPSNHASLTRLQKGLAGRGRKKGHQWAHWAGREGKWESVTPVTQHLGREQRNQAISHLPGLVTALIWPALPLACAILFPDTRFPHHHRGRADSCKAAAHMRETRR